MTKEEILAMEAGDNLDVEIWDEIFDQAGHILKYSTDISAAWQVVGKIFAAGFHLTLTTVYIHQPKLKYRVYFDEIVRIGNLESYRADADTAPEAICKAALLAKLEVKE